eukprot:3338583-Alexandrium_andersonii.AAC.1
MSASLVGSEMCIRDSPRRHPRPQLAILRRLWGQRKQLNPRPASLHSPRTVSYTHLTLPTICSV